MLRLLFSVALAVMTYSCATDPLELEEVSSDEQAVDDGLEAIESADLSATAPATLDLLAEHGVLTVAFSIKLSQDAHARLLIAGRHAVELPSLVVDGIQDREMDIALNTGVYQDLEVAYLPAREDAPALLAALYLNGNLVYYQRPLPTVESDAGEGLKIELQEGTATVENLRTQNQAGRSSSLTSDGTVVLNLPLIRYEYYPIDGSPDFVNDLGSRTPTKEGYISRFDLPAIREQPQDYAVRFSAELDIPQAGEYTFTVLTPAKARLYIDDRLVVDANGAEDSWQSEGGIELSEGSHQFRIDHYQDVGWNRINLTYTGPNGEVAPLNDMTEGRSIARPVVDEVVALETDDRPYLLRSFLNFPPTRVYDYTEKRTHVVSVGEADGPHYSYDLRAGNLLQVWRGDFLDVSQMWVDRGQPQTARALGAVTAFDGKSGWSSEVDQWGDTLAELRHLRYELSDSGQPTFIFGEDDVEVSDRILPNPSGGLTRTLRYREGGEQRFAQLAAARTIRELGPGTFELRGPGVNLEVTDMAAGGLRLLRGDGIERLVAELPPGESVTYEISW